MRLSVSPQAYRETEADTVIIFEFFSGTRSLTRPFEEAGHTVYSFELSEKFQATEHVDIRELTPEYLLETYGQPDFIWGSPPCTGFSVGSLTHHWRCLSPCMKCGDQAERIGETWVHVSDPDDHSHKPSTRKENHLYTPKSATSELGMELLEHTLWLIEGLNPTWWLIENPRAMMRRVEPVQKFERRTITHCQYGDPRRMKPTDIWGKFPAGFEARACSNGDSCHVSAPRGSKTGTQSLNTADSGMLPPLLGKELLGAMTGQRVRRVIRRRSA